MRIKPNSNYEFFINELKKARRIFSKWEGILFRASPLAYARISRLLDGRGSLKHGGRWSAAGSFRAVNLSTSPQTALSESGAAFSYYNLSGAGFTPKVIVGIRVKFTKLVKLTDPPREINWLRLDQLLQEDWRKVNAAGFESQSQALGRAVHDLGGEGMMVPSAFMAGGVNLVYFPESLLNPEGVKIMGEQDVERWLKKR